jgi:hypothetical protein
MDKQKKDFLGAFREVKSIKEMEVQPQQLLQEVQEKKKIGRPSHKSKAKEYGKVVAHIEKEYKDELQLLMLREYSGKFVSLEAFVRHILVDFLEKNKGA